MGMTIDEYIKRMGDIRSNYDRWSGLGLTPNEAKAFDVAINTMRKYQQLENFARWVATEVIDEEMWTYNHLAFTELACRKLVKLGIMQESDGEYTYEVIEDDNND